MGIQINGQTDRISAVDGSFSIQDLAEVNVTGVATASNFKTGTSNVHSTGYECTNINATGIVTAASANFTGNVSIGGTLTYEDVTNIDSVGIVTARAGVNISGGNLQVGGTNVINSGRVLYNLEQIKLADTKELVLGSGNDLKIYHSGSHSFISEEGAGALKIKGDDIRFEDAGGTEALRITSDGKVGINRTTPTAPITARRTDAGGTGTSGVIAEFANSSGYGVWFGQSSASGASWGATTGDFYWNTGGLSSPVERLRITSAGTIKCGTSATLKAEINSAIGGHQFISQCSDNNNGFEIYQQHGSTTTRNTFAVYANTGGGGAQELQFSVRGDGCVTKPKNPAFAARRIGDINISTSGNTDVVFNDELIDNGNNYNPSNGRFTASIAGTYYFGVNLYVGFSVTAVRVMHSTFNKNGSTYAAADLFGGTNSDAGTHYHPTGSSGMLIDLNVNDYVTFNLGSLSVTGSGNTFLYGTNGTRFFGYLVG